MSLLGDPIEARDGHVTMTYKDRFLVIYGGITESKNGTLVEIVDTKKLISRKVKNSELLNIPPFLESHTCTLIGGSYFIYGGQMSEGEEADQKDTSNPE